MKHIITVVVLLLIISCEREEKGIPVYNEKEQLGKLIFTDKNLSNPIGQSCSSCHNPNVGFSDTKNQDVSEGAVTGLFGNRNAPPLAYNVFSPEMYYNNVDETFIGGLFLDGRAKNLQEQALKPFLNPLEMNNTHLESLAQKIKNSNYYTTIQKIYGKENSDQELMNNVTDAIAEFEKSDEVNPFTSKFDYFIQGRATLTTSEKKGFALFKGKANCASCHVLDPDLITKKILLTDFSYDNIGVPKNTKNPFYNMISLYNPERANYKDLGLGKTKNDPKQNGKFKVPSLRNVAVSAPYFHNGSFDTLLEVIKFYNKRDLGGFPAPEISENVNKDELGNLKMTDDEENDLLNFLKTLTDGYHY